MVIAFPSLAVTKSDKLFNVYIYPSSDVAGLIRIQAVWRGYTDRKRYEGQMKDLVITRYQSCFTSMQDQIRQLNDSLKRVGS